MSAEPRARLRVLMSFQRGGQRANPFTQHLYHAVEGADVEVELFSWSKALFGTYDIFHVHWPENLFRGSNLFRTLVKSILGSLLLARFWLQKTLIVYTVHNLAPHESVSRITRWQVGSLARMYTYSIYLNESVTNNPLVGVTILHGTYPRVTDRLVEPEGDRASSLSTVVCIGQVRPYKGLEYLIDAFRKLDDKDVRLRVLGFSSDEEYKRQLVDRAENDPRIELRFEYLSDAEVERSIDSAELVVLPYPAIYNSGVALLALSNETPILVPDSFSTRPLRDEVGEDWVSLFGAPLQPADIQIALSKAHKRKVRPPELSRRRWKVIGQLHRSVYECVYATRRYAVKDRVARVHQAVSLDLSLLGHSSRNRVIE
ncbi:glycosyltransferase [Okibacterium endophyticum]